MNFLKNNFIKFIIIWIISTLLNYLVFFIIYKLWILYIVASSIWYMSWLILWYFLNKNYNFYLKEYHNTFIKYILIYSINLIISLIILSLLVEIYFINVYLSNFLILIYSTIANYLWIKYFVFKNKALLSIAIAWNSWCWKTVLTKLLVEIIWEKNISVLNWDSSHNWERLDKNWENITHLNPKANNLKWDLKDIKNIIRWLSVTRKFYDHKIWKYTKINTIESSPFIIYEWLHWLYKNISKQFDINFYIESHFWLANKISRDIDKRNRDRKSLLENIKRREKDYIKYILPQKENSNINVNYIEKDNIPYLIIEIKDWIDNKLKRILNNINWINIHNKKIEINQNDNFDLSDNILNKNWLNFITNINPEILINNSYKWIFKIIIIYLIQKNINDN